MVSPIIRTALRQYSYNRSLDLRNHVANRAERAVIRHQAIGAARAARWTCNAAAVIACYRSAIANSIRLTEGRW